MQLAAWVGLCLAAAVLLRNRCIVLIISCVVLWAAVPGVAAGMIIGQARGGSLGFHPATWLIFLTLFVQFVHDPRAVFDEIARRVLVYLGLTLFLSVALLATKTSASGSGLVLFFSQMAAPVMLFLLINVELWRHPDNIFRLRNWLIGIAAVESVLAIIEWRRGSVLLYRSFYQTQYWFDEVRFPRWMGTLDHWLTLSLLLCAVVPLLAGVRRIWIQLPLLLVMAGGVLATQSRTGLALVAVGILYVLVTSRIHPAAKVLSVVVVVVAGFLAATSALISGVTERLANDTGSSLARTAALDYFINHIWQFLFAGGGIGSSYQAADVAGLTTSLESSILIYAVDIGVVFAFLYFGIQLVIVARSFGRSTVPGLAFAGLAVVIVPQTYNALGAQTFAGILLWTVLGMASSMTSERARMALGDDAMNDDVGRRERELIRWSAANPRPATDVPVGRDVENGRTSIGRAALSPVRVGTAGSADRPAPGPATQHPRSSR